MLSNCPKCGKDDIVAGSGTEAFASIYCKHCGFVSIIDKMTNELIQQEALSLETKPRQNVDQIPPLDLQTQVYINNREHQLFLEQGVIVDKQHLHYRVKIVSCNESLNNVKIWIPEHWVRQLPF